MEKESVGLRECRELQHSCRKDVYRTIKDGDDEVNGRVDKLIFLILANLSGVVFTLFAVILK